MHVFLGAVHMHAFVAVFVSIAREVDFVRRDWRVECDCCRLQPMRDLGQHYLAYSLVSIMTTS